MWNCVSKTYIIICKTVIIRRAACLSGHLAIHLLVIIVLWSVDQQPVSLKVNSTFVTYM